MLSNVWHAERPLCLFIYCSNARTVFRAALLNLSDGAVDQERHRTKSRVSKSIRYQRFGVSAPMNSLVVNYYKRKSAPKFTFACRKEPVSTSAGSEAKRVRRLVCGFLVTLSHQLIEFTEPETRPVLSFGRFDGGRRNCGCGGPPKRRVPTLVLNLSSGASG